MQASTQSASSTPPPDEGFTRLVRFGSALGAGALAALIGSIPAAIRVAPAVDAPLGALGVCLALAAAALAPVIASVVVLRGARRGLASLSEPSSDAIDAADAADARVLGLLAWAFASLDALLVLGATLRAKTHHHALAGATFALVGLAVLLALGVAAARAVGVARGWPTFARRLFFGGAVIAFALIFFRLAARVARAEPSPVDLLVDLLVYPAAAAIAAHPTFARRSLAVIGPPLAALTLVIGLAFLRGAAFDPAVAARAPLLSAPVGFASKLVRGR